MGGRFPPDMLLPPPPKIGIIYYYVDTLAMIESLVHNIYII